MNDPFKVLFDYLPSIRKLHIKQIEMEGVKMVAMVKLGKHMHTLMKSGLYIDDIYRLRVQDPRIANETNDLRAECIEYANKLQEFKKFAEEFHKIISNFSKDVEREKLRAIGTQNRLKTIAKQRQAEQQVYQSQIHEKNIELERLRNEFQYLQRIESEQQEVINNFMMNQ